jgi:hypothetical protein
MSLVIAAGLRPGGPGSDRANGRCPNGRCPNGRSPHPPRLSSCYPTGCLAYTCAFSYSYSHAPPHRDPDSHRHARADVHAYANAHANGHACAAPFCRHR